MRHKPIEEVRFNEKTRRWICKACKEKKSPQQYRNKKNEEGDK
jgi:hypothetical protein